MNSRRNLRLVAALSLLLSLFLTGMARPASAPGWSVVPSPNVELPNGTLAAVSCPASGTCVAVGSYTDSTGASAAMAAFWSDGQWKAAPVSQPKGAVDTQLLGLSCLSASACMAVGFYAMAPSYRGLPFAVSWNGSTWRRMQVGPLPDSKSYVLQGVSCESAQSCLAVGYSNSEPLNFPGDEAEDGASAQWNGRAWTVRAKPPFSEKEGAALTGVSCLDADSCVAIGWVRDVGQYSAVVARWNGQAWSPDGRAMALGSGAGLLESISCVSGSFCMAVGQSDSGGPYNWPFYERLARGKWTTGDMGSGHWQWLNGMSSVSCSGPSVCEAVGAATVGNKDGQGGETVAQRWNGRKWTVQSTPDLAPIQMGFWPSLTAVSCADGSSCVAVGFVGPGDSPSLGIGLVWDGKAWRMQVTIGLRKGSVEGLSDVSCPTSEYCVALGVVEGGNLAAKSIVETWTGGRWKVQPMPSAALQAEFSAVSCATPRSCVAVGSREQSPDGSSHILVERWNGVRWQPESVPEPRGSSYLSLEGVSCVSADACTAVGSYYLKDAGRVPLIERWNGGAWTIQRSAPTKLGPVDLGAISCPDSTHCDAVGVEGATYVSEGKPAAEAWNGRSWRLSLPKTPSNIFGAGLDAVFCASAKDCMEVGSYNLLTSDYHGNPAPGRQIPLIEDRGGSGWTPGPNLGGSSYAGLTGVTCAGSESCVAVGSCSDSTSCGGQTGVPLVERWSGGQWRRDPLPHLPHGVSGSLVSVSCRTATSCVAVGRASLPPDALGAFNSETLVLAYH